MRTPIVLPARLLVVLVFATAAVPSSPRAARAQVGVGAGEVADEAEFHFDRGNQMYRQGRFDDALAAYYASNRQVPNRNVQFNIARCLEQLKRYPEAFRTWSSLEGRSPRRTSAPPSARRSNVCARTCRY